MNPDIETITPDTKDIDLNKNVYYVIDHIPDVENFSENHDNKFVLQNSNSIKYYFDYYGVDYKKKVFVFDHYLSFDGFEENGYFFPRLLIHDLIDFYDYDKGYLSVSDFGKFKYKNISVNCLMNKPRTHREIVSCWLNNNIEKFNLLYTQSWEASNSSVTKKFVKYSKPGSIKKFTELEKNWINFKSSTINYKSNAERFYKFFNKWIFSKTIFSLVLEPDGLINAATITEKYLFAIKGLTIPIVTGYRIYEKLNLLGFDTFDDIIDTRYQYEEHPIKRIWMMLERNKELMNGESDHLIKSPAIKKRVIHNYNLLQNPKHLIHNFQHLNKY